MNHRHLGLRALTAVAVVFACGGNPSPGTPGVEGVQPAVVAPSTMELTDERAMELGRTYAALVLGGDFERLWEALTPAAQAEFGTVDEFRSTGERIASQLGAEISVMSEAIEPARPGMRATKLYFRTSHYENAAGQPVRLLVGIMADGSVAGLQLSR